MPTRSQCTYIVLPPERELGSPAALAAARSYQLCGSEDHRVSLPVLIAFLGMVVLQSPEEENAAAAEENKEWHLEHKAGRPL